MSQVLGSFDCVNVVDLSFCESGRSFRIEIRMDLPPYETKIIVLRNAYSVCLSQGPDDGYPYSVPEMHWMQVPRDQTAEVLRRSDYGFYDQHQNPLVADRELLILELEGEICGHVLAETIEFE